LEIFSPTKVELFEIILKKYDDNNNELDEIEYNI
jgi:hypothetical protein